MPALKHQLIQSAWVVTCVAACSICASCQSEPERSSSKPTAPPAQTSYEQAANLVSLSGIEVAPVHWEDPLQGQRDPDLTQPLLAAQRFMTLSEYVYFTSRPADYSDAFRALVDNPGYLEVELKHLGDKPDPNFGHRLTAWLRVLQVDRTASGEIRVGACVDQYWNTGRVNNVTPGEKRQSFDPSISWVLVGQRPYEGTPRWRVLEVGANADPEDGERYEAVCEKWNHEHTEQPEPLPAHLVTPRPT